MVFPFVNDVSSFLAIFNNLPDIIQALASFSLLLTGLSVLARFVKGR